MGGPASCSSRPVLAVTGLAREAEIARGEGVVTVVGGGDPVALRTMLDAADATAYAAVLSFGIAAGLDPSLRPGDVIVATAIIADGRRVEISKAVLAMLAGRLQEIGNMISFAPIVGVDAPLVDAAAKKSLRPAASAADMESHVAAAFAFRCGLPLGALRVICDPADRRVPELALAALKPDGSTDVSLILRGVLRAPGQAPALLRLASDAAAGFRSLRRCRRLLGFGLGLADLG